MSEKRVCCQICEKIVRLEVFPQHSKICKEKAEAREELDQTKEIFVQLIERAFSLKTALSANLFSQKLLRSPTSKTHDDFLESPDNGGSKSYSPPIQRNITTPDVRRASSGDETEMNDFSIIEEETSRTIKGLRKILPLGDKLGHVEELVEDELKEFASIRHEIILITDRINDRIIKEYFNLIIEAIQDFILKYRKYNYKKLELDIVDNQYHATDHMKEHWKKRYSPQLKRLAFNLKTNSDSTSDKKEKKSDFEIKSARKTSLYIQSLLHNCAKDSANLEKAPEEKKDIHTTSQESENKSETSEESIKNTKDDSSGWKSRSEKTLHDIDLIIKTKTANNKTEIKSKPLFKNDKQNGSLKNLSKFSPRRNCIDEDVSVGADFLRGYYSDSEVEEITKVKFVKTQDIDIDDFQFIKRLGQGAYGKVYLVKKKQTGDIYAMKIIDFAYMEMTHQKIDSLKAENDIYKVLQGDYVVKAYWTFHYQNYICFVLEFMSGGDLASLLEEYGCLDKESAKFYFAELVLAVESLHKIGIVHRDLKPNNIMISSSGHIKLTDFGLSAQAVIKQKNREAFYNQSIAEKIQQAWNQDSKNIFKFLDEGVEWKDETPVSEKLGLEKKGKKSINHKKVYRIVGTPDYMAPEIINGDDCDNKAIDWWSMGVILYELLVGIPPFNASTVEEIFENINKMKIEWPPIGDGEDCICPYAVDLIKKLLNPDPKKRLGSQDDAEEIKRHPFFKDFDWEGIKDATPPIIPAPAISKESQKSLPLESVFQRDHPVEPSPNIISRNLKNLSKFNMRRIDLLYQKNAEKFKTLAK